MQLLTAVCHRKGMGREPAAVKKAAAPSPAGIKASPAKAAAAVSEAVSTAASSSGSGGDVAKSGGSPGLSLLAWAIRLPLIGFILYEAYFIRLYAIKNYGLVIHEFDPWFNFRATQCVRVLMAFRVRVCVAAACQKIRRWPARCRSPFNVRQLAYPRWRGRAATVGPCEYGRSWGRLLGCSRAACWRTLPGTSPTTDGPRSSIGSIT